VKWEQAAGFNELFHMIPLNLIRMVASGLTTLHRRPSTIATIFFNKYENQSLPLLSSAHILLLSAWYVPGKCLYQGKTRYIKRHVKEETWLALILGVLALLATEGLHLLFIHCMQFVWLSMKMTARINNSRDISSGDAFQKYLSIYTVSVRKPI